MSRVAVLKTSSRTVLKDYSELLDLSNYKKFLPKQHDTLLKLNLSWSLYFPSCSTEPWQLEGVIKKMQFDGYNLLPVENKTVVTNPIKGARLNKWLPILSKYNLKFQPLPNVEWAVYTPKHEMLAIPEIFPDGLKIPVMFKGKNVVHLPTMKVHGHTTVTGAIKNAFGGLITERRHHSHKRIHEVLVDLLTIQKEIHKGIFAVMDGTVAGDGAGPRTMTPRVENYILASDDQVAIDAVAAKMMGFDPLSIDFIHLAHDRGLGCGDFNQIDIIGEDVSNVNFGFRTSRSPVIWGDQLTRRGALRFLEPFLFHTKLFNIPIFLSAFYHDKLWYPTVGKRLIDEFMKTEWGRLFRKY